ncbi:uroporphyrinogen-III C-methyltransferase [Bradyrhizobium sp. 62B]|jgi:uroporphyrin-III C-methyltransferase|uniref:uroporphyrinogen-III C-methyltransferase n=1 Tax=Bradyrhizobium TaxID=374 RepID=UPI002167AD21|nr:uroporphyrinogen-III C-methyltransferase [Bradyrhizobium centrosematis]MCS3760480.1 uroporphyrin-III C-methyltransferase [Bradyrhizobium centrosematis]MCS3771633.1 uroporphyrin-III C-methyltransferase [Bradyrhizobium centrosematis]WIW48776.1 uroporphyrinogen-III C-methyltransferase [Bradyrhizobium sp. 62B]
MAVGKVYLVGAGPGDPELLTLKAVRAIREADVVVYDRLVPPEILSTIADGVLQINVGKQAAHHPVPQDEINEMLVRLARAGRTVVRLKGGDPFIFGRGSEEAAELELAGIAYEVVPGITAAQGCAAAARMPLTHRGTASGVRYVTGHRKANEPLDLDWKSLADPDTTLVVYMGLANIPEIVRNLIAQGLPGTTPVLAVCQGTTPQESRICAPLEALPVALKDVSFSGPVLFIIGKVAGLASERSARSDAATCEAISVVA